ncbi:MAG: ribosome rescue protein RqcH [Candidatus Bathyarchaeota archaeon]|nr:ribosome rescue protein RqcH [Candidatus Bathyarchaeota archaeon]
MLKKEFTSFDVASVLIELKQEILDSRVNNIYQTDAKTFTFKLHKTDKSPILLVFEAGRRIHLTNYSLDNPSNPPAFCMALRKYLRGAWLVNIEQYEFERLVSLSFKTQQGVMKLVIELFGEGNVILVNEKGEILQAMVYKRMRDRNILRGAVFELPPSSGKNPFKVNIHEIAEALRKSGDVEVVRTLARFLGIGGVYAEELLLRARIDKRKAGNLLVEDEVKAVFEALQSLLSPLLLRKLEACIVIGDEDAFLDAVPFKLKRYEDAKVQLFPSFQAALDEFYAKTTTIEKARAQIQTADLKREEEKIKRIIAEQQQIVTEAEKNAEIEKKIGDAIYAHSKELQILLDLFSKAKFENKNWNTAITKILTEKHAGKVPSIFFDSFDVRNLAINVVVDDLKFSLSLRKTLFENAAEFYERGKKAKQKGAGALAALAQSKTRLTEIQAGLSEAERLKNLKPAEALEALSKRRVESKEWYEKFRWFRSSEGFLVVAGKDVVSNEVLVKKYTAPHDVVFHAEIVGSPFVVVKTEGKDLGEQTLKEAGEYAASFSRAWREGMGSADVYWVKPDQLRKSSVSGEFVPHGAFAVIGKRNWMRSTPLRVAVGIIENNGKLDFFGGAVDAVKAKAKAFLVLVPGDQTGKDLLSKVLRELMCKLPKDQSDKLGKVSIEDIREFIPYTKGRVLQSS